LITKSGQEPLKYDFVFWHEVETLHDLDSLDTQFETWYNTQRIHSSIGYQTPWQRRLQDANLSLPLG
jgi:transposase InsO family protein